MTAVRQHLAVPLLLAAAACAGAPIAPPPAVAWPAPPAAARLRLVALWSAETLHAPAQGTLRRLAGLLVGEDAGDVAPPLLVRPFGVAVDAQGRLLVADPDARVVLRVDGDGLARPLACPGSGWAAPMAVAAGPAGEVLVADAGRGEVLRLGADGACRPLAPGAFQRPTGLLVAGGEVLVADPALDAVLAAPLDGGPVRRFSEGGDGLPYHDPIALARAADGTVLVVDAMNFRVARLAADGAWRGALTAPEEAGGLRRSKGVAVDGDGRVYVSDGERDQVLRFGQDGAFQEAFGARGDAPGWLGAPAGLAVDGDRLYVADSLNRRIQVFAILGERP